MIYSPNSVLSNPIFHPYLFWLIIDIKSSIVSLVEDCINHGGCHGKVLNNSWGTDFYKGPKPTHTQEKIHFVVFAFTGLEVDENYCGNDMSTVELVEKCLRYLEYSSCASGELVRIKRAP